MGEWGVNIHQVPGRMRQAPEQHTLEGTLVSGERGAGFHPYMSTKSVPGVEQALGEELVGPG